MAVPEELPSLCTPTVLTTQWVRGRSMKALSPAEKVAMARMSVECSVAQLLSTGVLHADPHEGNLLYGDDGRLYFLDFGLLSLMEQRCVRGTPNTTHLPNRMAEGNSTPLAYIEGERLTDCHPSTNPILWISA